MKPSHVHAPRTLADCDFRTGYPIAHPSRPHTMLEVILGSLVTIALVLMFVFTLVHWAAE